MMGWQWHQLDHMQITCTLLRTDNHASTSSINFHRPDTLRDAQPASTKGKLISSVVECDEAKDQGHSLNSQYGSDLTKLHRYNSWITYTHKYVQVQKAIILVINLFI